MGEKFDCGDTAFDKVTILMFVKEVGYSATRPAVAGLGQNKTTLLLTPDSLGNEYRFALALSAKDCQSSPTNSPVTHGLAWQKGQP